MKITIKELKQLIKEEAAHMPGRVGVWSPDTIQALDALRNDIMNFQIAFDDTMGMSDMDIALNANSWGPPKGERLKNSQRLMKEHDELDNVIDSIMDDYNEP